MNTYWNEYDKANCFNLNIYFDEEILILTLKTHAKWSPWDYIKMLALENG